MNMKDICIASHWVDGKHCPCYYGGGNYPKNNFTCCNCGKKASRKRAKKEIKNDFSYFGLSTRNICRLGTY